MNKPYTLLPIAIIILFLLPTPLGKFLIDLAGGIVLATLLIPIFLGGISWIGWQIIKSKMISCKSCGASYGSNLKQCPICGSTNDPGEAGNNANSNIPASSATIDIISEEVD